MVLRHSIKKWEGLRPENLERHEMRADHEYFRTRIQGVKGANFYVESASCSLCSKYLFSGRDDGCESCPLSKVRGDVACDEDIDGDDISPFEAWRKEADPEPMLHWLGEALKVAMRKEGK